MKRSPVLSLLISSVFVLSLSSSPSRLPEICYNSGFYFSFYVSCYISGYYFRSIANFSLASFVPYLFNFIFSNSFLVLLWFFVTCPLERASQTILRAELSSKPSSEGRSDKSSKLRAHQMALSEARLVFFLLDSLRVLLPIFPRFSQLGPLRRSGRTRTPSLCSTTTPSGASVPQGHLLFGAPLRLRGRLGVFRRREGHLLAAHLGPSLRPRLVLRFSSFTEAFPHSEVRRLWALFWSGPLSLLLWVCVLFCGPLFATSTSSGADGRVSRLRSSSCLQQSFSVSPHSCVRVPRSLSVQGRSDCVSRPRSSTWTYSFFVFLPFHCSRVCGSRVAPLCLPF